MRSYRHVGVTIGMHLLRPHLNLYCNLDLIFSVNIRSIGIKRTDLLRGIFNLYFFELATSKDDIVSFYLVLFSLMSVLCNPSQPIFTHEVFCGSRSLLYPEGTLKSRQIPPIVDAMDLFG